MNYTGYHLLFDSILNNPSLIAPYDNEMYMSYTKLNRSRMNRWDKHLVLRDTLIEQLRNISQPQHWIIITEPWCGDAAHIVPFLIRMTEQNPLITYELQQRDSEPFLIEKYLTHGSKSIPKLIVRDENEKDLFVWGPRPAGAQKIYDDLKESKVDFETMKIALQHWYNEDKGREVCEELEKLFG